MNHNMSSIISAEIHKDRDFAQIYDLHDLPVTRFISFMKHTGSRFVAYNLLHHADFATPPETPENTSNRI
jgi:hypothetical protein